MPSIIRFLSKNVQSATLGGHRQHINTQHKHSPGVDIQGLIKASLGVRWGLNKSVIRPYWSLCCPPLGLGVLIRCQIKVWRDHARPICNARSDNYCSCPHRRVASYRPDRLDPAGSYLGPPWTAHDRRLEKSKIWQTRKIWKIRKSGNCDFLMSIAISRWTSSLGLLSKEGCVILVGLSDFPNPGLLGRTLKYLFGASSEIFFLH